MNKNTWIKSAIILGLSFFIAIYLVKPVGVSTQFSVLSGIVHSTLEQDIISEDTNRASGYISSNEYYDKSDGKLAASIKNPLNYDFIFALAIPLGGFIGYQLLKRKKSQNLIKENINAEQCPINKKDSSFMKNYLPSFIGGFILLFGARMADGCTSGHMMSGMMQGSISGYVFAGCVFATAVPTAIIIKKLKSN